MSVADETLWIKSKIVAWSLMLSFFLLLSFPFTINTSIMSNEKVTHTCKFVLKSDVA